MNLYGFEIGEQTYHIKAKTEQNALIILVRKFWKEIDKKEQKFTALNRTVPAEILPILNLNDLNIQKQLVPYFLVLESEGAISRYISDVFGFQVADIAVNLSKSKHSATQKSLEEVEEQVKFYTSELQVLEGLDDLNLQLLVADDISENVTTLISKLSRLKTIVSSIELYESIALKAEEACKMFDMGKLDSKFQNTSDLDTKLNNLLSKISSVESSTKIIWNAEEVFNVFDINYLNEKFDKFSETNKNISLLKTKVAHLLELSDTEKVLSDKIKKIDLSIDSERSVYMEQLRLQKTCPYCYTLVNDSVLEQVLRSV